MTAEQISSLLTGAGAVISASGAAVALVIHAIRAKYGDSNGS